MDYYSILNVPKTASPEEIKNSFRRLAMKYHPDRNQNNPEAEEQFKQIKEAYDTLSDPAKRSNYDNPSPFGPNVNVDFNGVPPEFADVFRSFGFGFRGAPHRPQKNRNITVQVNVSLDDVLNGKEIVATIGLPSGKSQAITLKIPKGVKHGDMIRFPNLGDDSFAELPRGDLMVSIAEIPHPYFQRNGANLITNLEIPLFTALVGGTAELTNFDKTVLQLKIPEGTKSNSTFACSGQGLPINNTARGDLFVKVTLKIPTLSDEDKEIIQKLKEKYDS